VDDFYADWARAHFGPVAAERIAAIFTAIDGRLPRPSTWVHGPGGINPDGRPWDDVRKEYAFVDELAALRPDVRGAGNLERFDYWLDTLRYMRANARVNCTWHRCNEALKKVKAEKDAAAQKQLARELALPLRKELVAQVAEVHQHLLNAVATYGEIGNVTNWQQHLQPTLLDQPGQELAAILGEPLPGDATPGTEYRGRPRLFVPTLRSCLNSGEPLVAKAIVLGTTPKEVALHWRRLGEGEFAAIPLPHVARGVYSGRLPLPTDASAVEYYVQAVGDGGTKLLFPATAPDLNQTVVTVPHQE
jgi:hypothetical protein